MANQWIPQRWADPLPFTYETTGIDTRRDRPMQFAAIRTDLELREVGEPIELFAELGTDALMAPDATLIETTSAARSIEVLSA